MMKKEKLDSIQLSDNSITQVKDKIIITSRSLHDLVERSRQMAENGKIEELQTEASELGYQLLIVSQYNIERLGVGVQEKLTSIGRDLHLVETMRLFMDGGRSLQAILDKISGSNDSLEQLIDQLQLA